MKTIMELATALADLRVMVVKGQCVTSDEVADAYEVLRTRCAEIEADAKRYRWLRDNQQRIEIKRRKALMAIATGFTNYEYELFKTLDDAIDAAMKDAP